MVEFIKRDKNDIFNKPLLGFLFKNQKFLLLFRIAVAALFFYALYFGFIHPTKENIFTGALFWGIFWALFMVATLPSFGRIFCGICPHGFLGKYISKAGLNKTMPKWMQNRYIGIVLLVVGWWGVFYTFPSFWRMPITTAALFSAMTLLSFLFYYLYKDMSYCKYICPIGTLTRAYDKLSFTKLETYTDACKDCRTFECASACAYNLKPFSFAKKNQSDDCTLCMDCANSCEAVKFTITKPSEQLFSKFKTLHAEVWAYILILGSIPISMSFAHGLNRSKIADEMIWNKTAAYLGVNEYAGGFAFAYALLFSVFFAVLGIYLASKTLKKDYSSTFATLGYAFAPLFILGSLGHTLGSFFTHDYQEIVKGFAQAFGFVVEVAPLAHRGDPWLIYFGVLKWIGVAWAFLLLYKRLKLIEASKVRKIFGYLFASFLIFFFIGVNFYTGYVFKKYGSKHSNHMLTSSFAGKKHNMHTDHERIAYKQSDAVYFSLTDPNQKFAMHKMMMHSNDKNSIPTQQFWLVFGEDLNHKSILPSREIAQNKIFYYDVKQNLKEIVQKQIKGKTTYNIEVPASGYYNLYAKSEVREGDKHIHKVAKFEYLRGTHGTEDRYTSEIKKPLLNTQTKIDLLRIKNDKEDSFFYRHSVGDTLTFQALFDNTPLKNANLLLSMQSGWSKTVKTDNDGIAKFTIIRDYFPKSGEFDKRHKEEMLLTLTHSPSENEEYLLTYPLSFYPSSGDYLSKGYALIIIIFTLSLSGYIVYRYRQNRVRPFSELRYEE